MTCNRDGFPVNTGKAGTDLPLPRISIHLNDQYAARLIKTPSNRGSESSIGNGRALPRFVCGCP